MTFWYIALIAFTNLEDTPALHNVFNKISRLAESNAFLKLIKATYPPSPFCFVLTDTFELSHIRRTHGRLSNVLFRNQPEFLQFCYYPLASHITVCLVLQCSIYPVCSIMRHLCNCLARQLSLFFFFDWYSDR